MNRQIALEQCEQYAIPYGPQRIQMQIVIVLRIHVGIHVVVFGMFPFRIHVLGRQMTLLEISVWQMVTTAAAAGYDRIRYTRI